MRQDVVRGSRSVAIHNQPAADQERESDRGRTEDPPGHSKCCPFQFPQNLNSPHGSHTIRATKPRGFLPGYFALPAGIGDALVGVLAIPLALGLRPNSPFVRRLALGWNILGIVDLVNAVSMGVTSGVVQLQAAPSSGSAAAVSPLLLYPLVLVPTFGVPLALFLHSLSIRQLLRRGASLTASLLREGTA